MILHRTQRRVGTDPYIPGRTLGVGDARETSAGITDDWWQSGACRSSGIDMTAEVDPRARPWGRLPGGGWGRLDDDPPSVAKRKALCAACPVFDQCRAEVEALGPPFGAIAGVQAGMTDQDLRRARATY